jgi:hypothetical protein
MILIIDESNLFNMKREIMKTMHKKFFLFIAMAMVGILTSCTESEDAPVISYIRITNPASSDSLLAAAGQGQMIAIIGQNLQRTNQVWFNDQRAALTSTFVTSTSIIVRVPSQIPETITNELKLIFSNGESLIYDFTVDISEPLVARMKSEYVNIGETATFYGDYFYEPLVVTFSGDVEAEIVFVDDQELRVKVPAGAQAGPVTIASNFGTTESDFWFLDGRNIIANFEGPFVNYVWRGNDFVVAADPDIPNINGKFVRVNKGQLGAWPYLEVYGGPTGGDISAVTLNIPEEALLNPGAYSLKLEINTLESISGATMRLYLGGADNSAFGDARNNIYYIWQPNLDTGGEWETVSIPWADVYAANQSFPYNSSGYGMYIYFHGPNAAMYNFAFDNIRVVPNDNN